MTCYRLGRVFMATVSCLATSASAASAQGSTFLVSRASNGAPAGTYSSEASASFDGRWVAFAGEGSDFVAADTNGLSDVFIHDRQTGMTMRASVSSAGVEGNGATYGPRLSGDGLVVAYSSEATNLFAGDTNGWRDVFVHELPTGLTQLVSVAFNGGAANERSSQPVPSFDGRFVVFDSFATNLVPFDANGVMADVLVRDRVSGSTEIASVSSSGQQANAPCQGASMSADARYVAFPTSATNLVPNQTVAISNVYLRDRLLGTTTLASHSITSGGGNGASGQPQVSGDGRFVAFVSSAADLVSGDTNGVDDLFVFEVATGLVTRANLTWLGAQPSGGCFRPAISHDGSRVVFVADDADYVIGDVNGFVDVFLRDLALGTTDLVSRSAAGAFAADFSTYPALSGDGRIVAFESPADDMVAIPTGASRNVFVRDTLGCAPTVASLCIGGTTTHGCQATLVATGTPSASAGSGFTITVLGAEGQRAGVIFYGITGPQSVPYDGGSSVLCVHSPLQRTGVQSTAGSDGSCDGHFAFDWNQFIATHPAALGSPFLGGETVWAQSLFRDPGAPSGANLSAAIWFDVCH